MRKTVGNYLTSIVTLSVVFVAGVGLTVASASVGSPPPVEELDPVTHAMATASSTESPVPEIAPEPLEPESGTVPAHVADAREFGVLRLHEAGWNGHPYVSYVVGPGEDCTEKTIMNYALPGSDSSGSESFLSNSDGTCAELSVSYEIEPRRSACAGYTALVFELRVSGVSQQSVTYTVSEPAVNCEEFN